MKRARIGIIATAVLAVATMAFAQKPDFSGTWTPDSRSGGGGGRRRRSRRRRADDGQADGHRAVGRATGRGGGAPTTTVYKLDGSETKITMGQSEGTATAKWDGNKLVITTKAGETPRRRPGRSRAAC